MISSVKEEEFINNLNSDDLMSVLYDDIESLQDEKLINRGYQLHWLWDYREEIEMDIDGQHLRDQMKTLYKCVLSRSQNTHDLERLAILIPSLPYFIYSPDLPNEEDCFEPVDYLVWSFAERVSRESNLPQWIIEAAINALKAETIGINKEDLLEEPVYVWAIGQMSDVEGK